MKFNVETELDGRINVWATNTRVAPKEHNVFPHFISHEIPTFLEIDGSDGRIMVRHIVLMGKMPYTVAEFRLE
jgi:hypothetical protein